MPWPKPLRATTEFLQQVGKKYKQIGAIAPSSRALAREMVHYLKGERPSRRILEAGPGTGVVTAEIAKVLRPDDRLDVVEVNGEFIQFLRQRIDTDPAFAGKQGQIELIHAGLETVAGEARYDHIISGLPLNIFPSGLAREILKCYRRLLVPGGMLTYFEYIAARRMQWPFASKNQRRRLHRTGKRVTTLVQSFQVRCRSILLNLPPAFVRHLQIGKRESHSNE